MSLCLQKIEKRFKGQHVLRGVDLEVAKKEIHAIVGVSGSGKSTLLRIIAGLEKEDEGTLEWEDQSLGGLPPHKRHITLLAQSPLLFPHLTVGENIALATKDRSRPVAESWLKRVKLQDKYNSEVHELSGGEQQRVSLARALAAEPRLILLDEPFTNLDPELKYELQRLIRDLVLELELTAVLVTHDREEAMLLADRITLLESGRILATGTPNELYETVPAFGDFIEMKGTLYPVSRFEVTTDGDGERLTLVRKLARFGAILGEFRREDGEYLILPCDQSYELEKNYQLRVKEGEV